METERLNGGREVACNFSVIDSIFWFSVLHIPLHNSYLLSVLIAEEHSKVAS